MIKSMTGFGSSQGQVAQLGKISIQVRSTNHKFLETVLHLPEGFLSLEETIKKEVQNKVKRGRITFVMNIMGGLTSSVFINKKLLKEYIAVLKNTKDQFSIKDEISINTLIHLPGVLSLAENRISAAKLWPALKPLAHRALTDLDKMRQKEGRALYGYLIIRARALRRDLETVKIRFKKVIKAKLVQLNTDEERSSFLKDTDISEEMERLSFHIRNFNHKLSTNGYIGKELDFIAQEMQRETNTMGAKCPDTVISTKVVQIKSQIEKIREQAQNIE